MNRVEVLFSPAEFEALDQRPLREATCVVFDVLRATSSIVTALAHNARAIIPVQTIEEAAAIREMDPSVLLAGERDGYRITGRLAGGRDFDLGNSPREFTSAAVGGKTIVMTTTNGTRALKACRGAREILAASFLNLNATVDYLRAAAAGTVLVVCSGTHEEASFEDTLAAGALLDALWPQLASGEIADSAQIARTIFRACAPDLLQAMTLARNGRRLLGIPELRADVAYCLQRDLYSVIARLEPNGGVVRLA